MALIWPQVRYGLELPGLPRTSGLLFCEFVMNMLDS